MKPQPVMGRCPVCRADGVWLLPTLFRGVTYWSCSFCDPVSGGDAA